MNASARRRLRSAAQRHQGTTPAPGQHTAADPTTPPTDQRGTTTPAARAPDQGDSLLRSAVSIITTLGPPLTIATALMIYFGWARSDAQARAMGLDVSLFRFSTQDYVLQSISTLYVPLLAIVTLALGGLALHRQVERALERTTARPTLRRAGRMALGVGVGASVAAVLVASRDVGPATLISPLVLAGGTAVAAYGGWLAAAARDPEDPVPATPSWQRALRKLLVGSLITAALFWELSDFAGVVGRGYAQRIESTVSRLPRVTVFSSTPLGIEAPGVHEQPIAAGPAADAKAGRYRTTGLRFLVSSGGRMFLLHDGWKPRTGAVVVLPDNEQIRWQFSR